MEGTTMNNKSSILQLAKTLAEKDGLEQAAAENFVKTMFGIANEALQDEKLVKIKWLGTFKVMAVKDRESVDVNTGERIMIEGRDKISFTPDNILKEIVNKPFAQFETVTVNDGVDFAEIDEKFAMREAEETPGIVEEVKSEETGLEAEVAPEPELNEESDAEFVPVLSGEEEKIEEVKLERVEEEQPWEANDREAETSDNKPSEETQTSEKMKPSEESKTEESPAPQEISASETATISQESRQENSETDSPRSRSYVVVPRYVAVVACCLILALVGGMGWFAFNYGKMSAQRDYLAHQRDFLTSQLNAAKYQQPAVKADTVPSSEDSVQLELKCKAREDSARMAKVSKAIESKDKEQDAKKPAQEAADKQQEIFKAHQDKYDSDVRIRTGAYRIVGVAQKIKVKPGQTLEGISKSYLGAGMECYIEALNGTSKVSAGQEIKIPKLELKKTRKNLVHQ